MAEQGDPQGATAQLLHASVGKARDHICMGDSSTPQLQLSSLRMSMDSSRFGAQASHGE